MNVGLRDVQCYQKWLRFKLNLQKIRCTHRIVSGGVMNVGNRNEDNAQP